jgi:Co/Zn/Cd efflux system component
MTKSEEDLRRAVVGKMLAGILLVPGLATLWMAWQKFSLPVPPEALPLSLTGIGALVVNLSCALLLTKYRHHAGSLTRAAFPLPAMMPLPTSPLSRRVSSPLTPSQHGLT